MDDEMDNLYEYQTMVAVSISSFLENILPHVRRPPATQEPVPTPPATQQPAKDEVVPGGYAEDIFIFLSDQEKEEYQCSVCYNMLKDAHQCRNGHMFCYTCVYAWSTSISGGSSCCPMCRCDGLYARNDKINERVGRKRVKCQQESCNWRGSLRLFDAHKHRRYDPKEIGMENLPNITGLQRPTPSTVKISSLQPTTQTTSEFMRSFNMTEEASDDQQPEEAVAPPQPQPPSTESPRNQPIRRNSVNSGPRRIIRPPANNSVTDTESRRSSGASLSSMPPTRPGMVPRPPTQTRPPRAGTNTGVTQSNRPLVARRPSRDVETENRSSSEISTPVARSPSAASRAVVPPTALTTTNTATAAPLATRTAANVVTTSTRTAATAAPLATRTAATAAPLATRTAATAAPLATRTAANVATAAPLATRTAANVATAAPLATRTAANVATAAPLETRTTATAAPLETITAATAAPLATSIAATATPLATNTATAHTPTTNRPLLQRERISNGSIASVPDNNNPSISSPMRPSSPALEYRRLAPIRQAPRITERLRDGRDQLAMMLTLVSLELEGRRRNIEHHAAAASLERERFRQQEISEVQTLNRRLSMVANNLERIISGPHISVPVARPRYQSSTMTLFREDSSSDEED